MRRLSLMVLLALAPPVCGQTGSWTVSAKPSSFAVESGHALTADALAAEPASCGPGLFAIDLAANGTLTCAAPPAGGVTDHGALTGLGDDDHLQYPLLAGRSGGQVLTGGTAPGNSLVLRGSSADNASSVFIQRGPDASVVAEFRNGGVFFSRDLYPAVDGRAWVRFGVVPSATTPVLLPSSLEAGTGIGRAGTGQLSLIASSSEVLRVSAGPGTVTVNNLLRLTPAAAPPAACSASTEGAIYYRSGGTFCACNGSAWAAFLGPGPCSP